jgi:hypothetical protein
VSQNQHVTELALADCHQLQGIVTLTLRIGPWFLALLLLVVAAELRASDEQGLSRSYLRRLLAVEMSLPCRFHLEPLFSLGHSPITRKT